LSSRNDAQPPVHARRLFFGLWPTEALRQQIGAVIGPILDGRKARPIPLPNLHLTLAFLGSVSATTFADVVDAANQIDGEAFSFAVDHLEIWRRAHVACLTIEPTPPPLAVLVERLRFSLLARKVAADQKEFKAHVTIARDWHDQAVDERVGPFVWNADEFVLVESRATRAGSEYTILERWPLAPKLSASIPA